MSRTKLPRLLDSNLREQGRLHPLRLNVTQNLAPLSSAEMELPPGETVQLRQLVELSTPTGSAGIFRVTAVQTSHRKAQRVTLSHSLCTLSDVVIPGSGERTGSLQQLLEVILQPQALWTLGTVEAPEATLTWQWDHSNALEALTALMAELPGYYLAFDQSITPWQLHVLRLPDTDGCECTLSRGMTGITIKEDDSELCTRLMAAGLEAPLEADTMGTWGTITRTLEASPDLPADMLQTAAQAYLEQHKNPKLTITIDAVELARRTGDPFDRFTCGKLCRTRLDGGAPIRQHIVRLQYPDTIGTPDVCKVTLASTANTASAAIAGLVVDTTVLRKQIQGQGKKLTLQAEEIELLAREIALKASQSVVDGMGARISEVSLELDAAQTSLLAKAERTEVNDLTTRVSSAELYLFGAEGQAGLVTKVAENDDLLSQVKLDLDAAQTALLAKAERSELQDLTTRVTSAELYLFGADGQAGLVTKVAENRELIGQARLDLDAVQETATLLTGQIDDQGDLLDGAILRLDGVESDILMQADTIRQKADLILLDGYVKVTELAAANAAISNLTSGLTTATVLRATLLTGNEVNTTYGSFSSLTHAGSLVSQRKVTMGTISTIGSALSTGGELDLQHSHEVIVADDGTVTLGEVATKGGNFRIADTKAYKDGVSAAVNSVTLAASGWDGNAQNTIKASNGQELKVTIPNVSMGESYWLGGKKTVSAYYGNSGQLGTLEVEIPDISISWSNPQQNYAMVTVTVGGKTRTDSRNISGYT